MKWEVKNAKDSCKCGQSMNRGALGSRIRCELIVEEGYWNPFGGKDPNSA
jgi:hypothetical protein